jgi:Domain of unknown function (DUF4082)
MRRMLMLAAAVLTAFALVAIPTAAGATGSAGAGLWPSTHEAAATDCGSFTRDTNNFCYIDDGGAVELGVKFTTSMPVLATGVRIYRVDGGSVTGSLWKADGTLLATGEFAAQTGHGWQDLVFATPVPIVPGQSYIASYFAANADYAFEWNFFTNSAFAVGPITAQQSVEGDRNGVYCYVGESCNLFPTNSFRDTNYWVTPLWAYDFDGFYQPVDNSMWNKAKAGSAIPVKFSLGGDYGLNVLKAGYPKAIQIACPNSSEPTDAIEETVTAGGSSLSYDPYLDEYIYVWKTTKGWAGKCFQFDLGLNDDTSHTFDVQFVK